LNVLIVSVSVVTDDYVKKTFQFITVCKGDMNHQQTENGKSHFRAEFGAVSPCVKFLLPFQGEPFWIGYLWNMVV